jgi:hypothetical protein
MKLKAGLSRNRNSLREVKKSKWNRRAMMRGGFRLWILVSVCSGLVTGCNEF